MVVYVRIESYEHNMHGRESRDISKGKDARFAKADRGLFGLAGKK
jgi:hypothetical protein